MQATDKTDSDYKDLIRTVTDHKRKIASMVERGYVVEPSDEEKKNKPAGDTPRVLVQIGGDHFRKWLPWLAARSGWDGEWWCPDIGEEVVVIAPSGEIEQGYIVGSINPGYLTFKGTEIDTSQLSDTKSPHTLNPDETSKHIHQRVYQDGSQFIYDRDIHKLFIELRSQLEDAQPLVALLADAGTAGEESIIAKVGDGEPHAAIKNDGTVTLSGGATKIIVNKDGAINLNAGTTQITVNKDGTIVIDADTNEIGITGNVKVTGSLDVSP